MSLFGMWVPHCVPHGIAINIFLVRKQHCWNKSFEVCPLRSAKSMAWIFQKGCKHEVMKVCHNQEIYICKMAWYKIVGLSKSIYMLYKENSKCGCDFYFMEIKACINSEL